MFNDTAYYISEDRRRELLLDADRIRKAGTIGLGRDSSRRTDDPGMIEFSDYIKTGLAAIFHR
jgi:hypothetical protein